MITREYVKKYNLDKSNKFDHSAFVQDLANDFIALLEINKAENNIKGFENALRCVKMRYDAIGNKTIGIFPEKLWGYFYATVAVKLREELCPKDMQKRREEKERKRKEWEEQKKWDQYDDFFEGFDYFRFFSFVFGLSGMRKEKPVESFQALGLSEDATAEEVKSVYKKLAIVHHPDKGGKQEDFIKITENKNNCLSWIESQTKEA